MVANRVCWVLSVGFMVIVSLAFVPFQAVAATDTLVIGMQDEPLTLDPAMVVQAVEFAFIDQVYEKLVGFAEEQAQPVPVLAKSWDIGEDGKTWRIHLRQDRVFASGNPVNAEAVEFSLRRTLALAGSSSWMLTQIGLTEERITTLDEYTVQLALDKQYAPTMVLACLMTPVASILDPAVVMEHEQNGDQGTAWLADHSAGSGRFVLQERKPNESTTFVANEQNTENIPVVKTVVVRNILEPIEQAILLEKSEIDIAWDLQANELKRVSANPDIQIFDTPMMDIRFVGMNLTYEPLSKPDVRKAIRFAIDYDGILDFIVEGAGEKIQTIIPKGLLGYNPAMPYTFDPEKARQLLAGAGYSDGFEVELACEDRTPWIDIALQIKSDLARVGITVTIKEFPTADLFGYIFSKEFQLYLVHWETDYFDPDANAKPFAHCNSAGDDAAVKVVAWLSGYVNLETSALVGEAAFEQDQAKREELYTQITNILLEDGPYAVLFSPFRQYGVRFEATDVLGLPSAFLSGFPILK